MESPWTELKEAYQASPYTGLNLRSKFFSVGGEITTANVGIPQIHYIKIPDYEYYWVTDIRGAYYLTAGAGSPGSLFFNITNEFDGENIFKTPAGNVTNGFAQFDANLSPGILRVPVTSANHKKLTGEVKPNICFKAQQSIKVTVVRFTAIPAPFKYDILFIGMAQRLDT